MRNVVVFIIFVFAIFLFIYTGLFINNEPEKAIELKKNGIVKLFNG